MSRAIETATALASEYYGTRGEDTPEDQAASFLPRTNYFRRTEKWRSDDLVDTAATILEIANIVNLVVVRRVILPATEPIHSR